jgi:hypothetical protein
MDKKTRNKPLRYQVNHPDTSGGPKFSSLTEALAYISHCIRNGNRYMTISNLKED